MRQILASLLFLLACTTAWAQETPVTAAVPREAAIIVTPAEVRFRGEVLFSVSAAVGDLTPQGRARAITARLQQAASEVHALPGAIRIEPAETTHEVFVGDHFIVSVTDLDAEAQGATRSDYAAFIATRLVPVLRTEIEGRRTGNLLKGASLAVGATLVYLLLLAFAWRSLSALERSWRARDGSRLRAMRVRGRDLITVAQKLEIAVLGLRISRLLLVLVLTLVWAGLTLSLFPWTRGTVAEFQHEALAALRVALGALWDYLPNLLYIGVIALITRVLLNVARFFFRRIELEQLRLHNFYPEWAEPTYRIVRFVAIALALILMYPYLPASQSTAFQGVSVLLGVLVSIGSASALTNMVAGLVITYMRAFRRGDRVRIGDTVGDVISRDAFVVRIRTVKNVEITVPNGMVLTSHVVNYSTAAAETGLILHTTVTIGYDVDWRQVHELLLAAARETENVEADPEPFVLQKSLDDFYVSYELNAHTREPRRMSATYSGLHANILDQFRRAGVEIMSPHYRANREAAASTVPLAGDERPPGATPQAPEPIVIEEPEGPSALESEPQPEAR